MFRKLPQTGKNFLESFQKNARSNKNFVGNGRQLSADAKKSKEIKEPEGQPYGILTIGVPKETFPNERRVALTPSSAQMLIKKGFTVNIEKNAGAEAKFFDGEYERVGAKIVDKAKVYSSANIVLKVRQPQTDEIPLFKERTTLISFLYPAQNKSLVEQLAKKQMNLFAMDCIPRISRAQVIKRTPAKKPQK